MTKTNLWRYALLSMLLTYLSYSAQGQITLKYDTTLIKKIADDVCGCYQNLEISDADLVGGPLIGEKCANAKILKYRKELNLFTDLSEEEIEKEETLNKVPISFGMRLMPFLYRDCPDFVTKTKEVDKKIRESYREEIIEEPVEYEIEEEIEGYEYSFSGKIKAIKQIDNLTFVVVQNEKKEKKEFLWLNRFGGDELLMNDIDKKKQVYIEFIELELLNPKTAKMSTYQRITWITLAD